MRVLVVDDHEVVRRGVRSLILSQDGYEVCGEAVDGQDAVEKAQELRPDVIVMDVSMPRLNGLEATHLICATVPDSRILILSQHDSPEMVRQAFKAGASGYVVKSSIARDLIAALNSVSRQQTFFDPAISQSDPPPLTHIDSQEVLQRSAALEQALRESEELHRSTFELTAVGVAHVTPDGRFLRVNDKLCEITGYSKEDLLKITSSDITHPDDREEDLPDAQAMKSGALENGSMEKRYVRKDGTTIWVNLTVSGVRNSNGDLKHFIWVVEDITQRREGEEARNRLAAIVESSDDAIVSKDLNGIIASWNAGAQRIFGYTPEEAIGRSITLIIPSEMRDEEKQIIRRLRNGERIEHFETIRVNKSGKRLNISLTVSPVKNSKGKIIGASKVARDVTEQKRMLEALLQREVELNEAQRLAGIGSWQWISETDFMKWSPEMYRIAGRNPELAAPTYKEHGELYAKGSWIKLQSAVNEALATGRSYSLDLEIIRPDGTMRWVVTTGEPERDSNGVVIGLRGTVQDVTDRKRGELARLHSEQRFRAFFQSAAVGAVRADAETGKFLEVNETFCRMVGYTQEELQSRTFLEITHPEDRDKTLRGMEQKRHQEIPTYETEKRYVKKDGTILWVHLAANLVPGSPEVPTSYISVLFDITKRKAAEEAQRVSESRLDLALNACRTAFFEWDLVKQTGKWNSQMTAIYDFTPAGEEITPDEWQALFHPDDVARLVSEAQETYRTKDEFQFEYRAVRPDRSIRWISSRGRIVRDGHGKPLQMIGVHVDITQQKRAEEALRREEQQFRVLADSIAELCWMARPDGHRFWFNQRWYEYTGTRLEQVEGSGWQSVHDPAILPNVLEKWRESIQTGQPFEMVFPLRAADGTFRHFLTRIRPLKDENGKVLRWFGTNTDIASQRLIEEELRKSGERLRAAFAQTYSFLVLLAPDGTIVDANRAALEAAGQTREEVFGQKIWEPWWAPLPEEVAVLQKSVARAARGEMVREECYYCLPDGTRRFADRTLNPVHDDSGKLLMIVASGLDITEQKELREKLEARVQLRTQELEEKNKILLEQAETVRELSGRLLRAQDEERRRIARDLHDSSGQILVAVQMNLAPLETQAHTMNPDFAKGIRESMVLIEQLSKELRTVSYLLHPPLLDEAGLPSALRWYVEGFAERSKIEVRLEVSEDVGRLPSDMEMTIFRIVQEGLTNIHRHSGGKQASIRVFREAEEVNLEIQDDGRGMAASYPGSKAAGSNNAGSSNGRTHATVPRAGVGIQGMRERVKQLGGTFEIQSNEHGTLITAAFPLATPSAQQTV